MGIFKNKFILSFFILFIVLFIVGNKFKWQIYQKLPNYLKSIILISTNNKNYFNLMNDYNVKFLPDTQKVKISFEKIKLISDKDSIGYKGFFLDVFKENILITTKKGNFFKVNIKNLDKIKNIEIEKLTSPKIFEEVLDIFILDNKIYVSSFTIVDQCKYLNIHSAIIDQNLDFILFKEFEECGKETIRGGRIQEFFFEGNRGLLITTGDLKKDFPNQLPQDQNSIFGKVIFINLDTKDYFIYSKGHRNAQGLAVKKDIILSSEHGPKGGDEINKISVNKNYGWPNASYGLSYDNKREYLPSHMANGYEEPLYTFVPSIGISEIIFLPDAFNYRWKNNILITSLSDKSIYRVKFQDKNFNRILYLEKIFVGERIRDIKYLNEKKVIILALEDSGSLGMLRINDKQ